MDSRNLLKFVKYLMPKNLQLTLQLICAMLSEYFGRIGEFYKL